MGIVQDTLCGIRKFTLRDTFLDWAQVQNILLWVPDWDGSVPTPAIIKPKPLWTGKQILSMCIPRGINIYRSPDPKSNNPVFDDGMMIENGDIVFGIVEKKTVGASQGGLVHVVFREKGPEATRTLFSGLQQVVGTFSGLASQYDIPELWISEMADTSNPSDLSPYTNYLDGAVDRYAYNLNDLNGATL